MQPKLHTTWLKHKENLLGLWFKSNFCYTSVNLHLNKIIIRLRPRETNIFQISVNVAANSKAVFNLTYQELLKRVHGVYKHIVNLQPDQVWKKWISVLQMLNFFIEF